MAKKGLRYSKREVFEYLDGLRASGITNMFGAAPYVEKKFGCTRGESRRLVSSWMAEFGWKQLPAAPDGEKEAR